MSPRLTESNRTRFLLLDGTDVGHFAGGRKLFAIFLVLLLPSGVVREGFRNPLSVKEELEETHYVARTEMKRTLLLVVVVVAVTTALVLVGLHGKGRSTGTIGVAAGSALPGFSENANTPEQGLANFLSDIQRRHWSRSFQH